jgi:hypothetical protein
MVFWSGGIAEVKLECAFDDGEHRQGVWMVGLNADHVPEDRFGLG